ncbi:FAD-binding oxidoreductase [Thioalkalivibrio thiocyanodenitrificans]|uniref:FAD-binding oxidoreductase n=1 Tax=Thioalkalivibrio thiocyanodenitrificans TaxID=243063 RepID=UPI0006850694|nr:FAD-binding oxidoreductase [Thioalkalivibrio thiocyanodenitrificans]
MRPIESWGRYPQATPARVTRLADRNARLPDSDLPMLVFGNGRSYGDVCLNDGGHVLLGQGLDHLIAFDPGTGILCAEAGVLLADILEVVIPHGWFLPVTPGTCHVTLGGAVANDVHGKNHHRAGTFGCHVLRLGLVRSDREPVVCSPMENPELFQATIGGLGLTGLIHWVEIQLAPIHASDIETTAQRFRNLEEFFEVSAALDTQHEFSVSWIDCLAQGDSAGRGVFMAGNFTTSGSLNDRSRSPSLTVPFIPPIPLVNTLTTRVFNEFYWRRHPTSLAHSTQGYRSFFYPLDAISNWNRIYGRRGFQQYQCVIPEESAGAGLAALLKTVADRGQGSLLAVLKKFGHRASPGLLSFPMPGVTLALDFPQSRNLEQALFPELDAIVQDAGGRLYPAKDAHMAGPFFRRSYPAWERLEALRDPAFCSSFWKRVLS